MPGHTCQTENMEQPGKNTTCLWDMWGSCLGMLSPNMLPPSWILRSCVISLRDSGRPFPRTEFKSSFSGFHESFVPLPTLNAPWPPHSLSHRVVSARMLFSLTIPPFPPGKFLFFPQDPDHLLRPLWQAERLSSLGSVNILPLRLCSMLPAVIALRACASLS